MPTSHQAGDIFQLGAAPGAPFFLDVRPQATGNGGALEELFDSLGGPENLWLYERGLAAEGIFPLRLAPEGVEMDAGDRHTATLGRLYLRQGFYLEAEAIFRAVVAREPENEAAHSGLQEALRLREQLVASARKLQVADPAIPPLTKTARKLELVGEYLRQLRRRAGRGMAPQQDGG